MTEKTETVTIQVSVAERLYPLKVTKSDEAKVRLAENLVNEKIKTYQNMFQGKDKQDYMAMCLLNLAVEFTTLQSETQHNHRLTEEKLNQLEEVLSGI